MNFAHGEFEAIDGDADEEGKRAGAGETFDATGLH
jgi:hypothetical protein